MTTGNESMKSSKQHESQFTEEEWQRLKDFFELLIEADRDDRTKKES